MRQIKKIKHWAIFDVGAVKLIITIDRILRKLQGLLAKHRNNAVLVDKIIAEKTAAGMYMDNPDHVGAEDPCI